MTYAEEARKRQLEGFNAAEVNEIVTEARNAGLNISASDVQWSIEYGPTIDGMPARDWIDAQTL